MANLDKKDFLELRNDILTVLGEAKKEALADGVNIVDKRFRETLGKIKDKIIESSGVDRKEFDEMSEKFPLEDTAVTERKSRLEEVEQEIKKTKVSDLARRIFGLKKKL